MDANIARDRQKVKAELLETFEEGLDRLFDEVAEGANPREVESGLWREVLRVGGLALSYLFAMMALRESRMEMEARGISGGDFRWRMDRDYWATITTTFGEVVFPWFAFRDTRGTGMVTRTPARSELFPHYKHCRSSTVCLEWETRLGGEHPFRNAEEALEFYSHGAVDLEDTTIAAHTVEVGRLIDRKWLYRSPQEIRHLLESRATRDPDGLPLVYVSSDAHGLRRYTDQTWDWNWKMTNGIRIWCEDRETGRLIHLGGEYTWGDCEKVGEIFEALDEMGVLPFDGDYGEGVEALYVWLSDGMPWFEDHILPKFSRMIPILDIQHALRWIAKFGASVWGENSDETNELYSRARKLLCGHDEERSSKNKRRKGHTKTSGQRNTHAYERVTDEQKTGIENVFKLVEILGTYEFGDDEDAEERDKLQEKLIRYSDRMLYAMYRRRGYHIGSGAMESMHRQVSQLRAKRTGARWLEETSQAIFNVRTLQLVDRWDEFWERDTLEEELAESMSQKASNPYRYRPEAESAA